MKTHQERFAEACSVQSLNRQSNPARHYAYSVRVVSLGQVHEVDGPFFTESEACIAAEILRKSCRSAKVTICSYQDHPAITPQLVSDCIASRSRLAIEISKLQGG